MADVYLGIAIAGANTLIVNPWIHQAEDRNSFRGNVPKVHSTRKNLAISTNAEMAKFVRYVGGCRPGDDSH